LPVGLSFVGTAWTDAQMLGLAYAYEQASHALRAPAFVASVNPRL
jgi:amidase